MSWWDNLTFDEKMAQGADTAWQGQGIGNPENYGGSSAVDTDSRWATWGQNTKNVLGGLKSIMQNGFDKAAAQSPYNNMGMNRFAYLTGIIGDALNPNSNLKGVGQSLAQQNQFNRAQRVNQAKKSKIKETMKAILMGEEEMTEKGKPGLTNALITTGKDGKPIFKMEYDLDDLAGIYNPEDNNILSTDQQRQLAQQSASIDEFEMRLAQAIQAKARDERDWKWKAAQYADTLKEKKADNMRQDKYLGLAEDKFTYEKGQDDFMNQYRQRQEVREAMSETDKIAERQRKAEIDEVELKLKKENAEIARLNKESLIETRKANLKLKQDKQVDLNEWRDWQQNDRELRTELSYLKAGYDRRTGEKLPEDQQTRRLTAIQQVRELNDVRLDTSIMLKGKIRRGSKLQKATNIDVANINDRIAQFDPQSNRAFIWDDDEDEPILVEFTNGVPIGKLFEDMRSKNATPAQITEWIKRTYKANPELLKKVKIEKGGFF